MTWFCDFGSEVLGLEDSIGFFILLIFVIIVVDFNFDLFGDVFDVMLRGEGRGEDNGEVIGEGNIVFFVLLLLLFRKGNIGIVDNFWVRVVIEFCDWLVLGDEDNLRGGFCGKCGLFVDSLFIIGFWLVVFIFLGKEGRGFFGGKGFDFLSVFEILKFLVFFIFFLIVFSCFVLFGWGGCCGEIIFVILLVL